MLTNAANLPKAGKSKARIAIPGAQRKQDSARRDYLLLGLAGALAISFSGKAMAVANPWFKVVPIDRDTFMIYEPRFSQHNSTYLLRGRKLSVLVDSGSGTRNLYPLALRLAGTPVMVIPSHLHFDHIGGIAQFPRIGLIDLPSLRRQVHGNLINVTHAQSVANMPFRFKVTNWLQDGQILDLGGRQVQLLRTPGHTPESVSLFDRRKRQLFVGDLANRGSSWAFMPGSSLASLDASLRKLLTLPDARQSLVYDAHHQEAAGASSLADLDKLIQRVAAGKKTPFSLRCYMGAPVIEYEYRSAKLALPKTPSRLAQPVRDINEYTDDVPKRCAHLNE